MWMIIAIVLYALAALGFAGYAVDNTDPRTVGDWAFFIGACILWPILAIWIIGVVVVDWIRR